MCEIRKFEVRSHVTQELQEILSDLKHLLCRMVITVIVIIMIPIIVIIIMAILIISIS